MGAAGYVAAGRPRALAWWAAVALMLDWHLGMAETEDGLPRPLGPADAATLSRAWLAPLVAARPAPALLALGYASDVADGTLARTTAPTRLGRDLEGLADVAFGLAALRGLVRQGALPVAAAAAEALRLTGGTLAATTAWLRDAEPPSEAVLRAARAGTPMRAAGVLAAAAGRRRLGTLLVVAGSAAALAARWPVR